MATLNLKMAESLVLKKIRDTLWKFDFSACFKLLETWVYTWIGLTTLISIFLFKGALSRLRQIFGN